MDTLLRGVFDFSDVFSGVYDFSGDFSGVFDVCEYGAVSPPAQDLILIIDLVNQVFLSEAHVSQHYFPVILFVYF
jgi:hypothetical protein